MASKPAAQAQPNSNRFNPLGRVPSTPSKARQILLSDQERFLFEHSIGVRVIRAHEAQDSDMLEAPQTSMGRPPSPQEYPMPLVDCQTVDEAAAQQLLSESDTTGHSSGSAASDTDDTEPEPEHPSSPPRPIATDTAIATTNTNALLRDIAQQAQQALQDKINVLKVISDGLDGSLKTLEGSGQYELAQSLIQNFIFQCRSALGLIPPSN